MHRHRSSIIRLEAHFKSRGCAAGTIAIMVVVERLTAEEYLAREDPRRTDLIDGIVVVNEPGLPHQHAVGQIYRAFRAWEESGGRGQVTLALDLRLEDDQVYAPDLMWFVDPVPLTSERAPRVPDLVVEVRSPSTWVYDMGRKRELYERHGVRELWLADPFSRSIYVLRRPAADAGFAPPMELFADDVLTSPLLSGFNARVGDLLVELA
jgi:Uma2 family endonuclease